MSIPSPRDPLLGIARLCTTLLLWLFGFCAAAVLFGATVLMIVPAFLRDALAQGKLTVDPADVSPEVVRTLLSPSGLVTEGLILLIVAIVLAAAFQFVRQLRRIIDSVGAGDPFSPANAERLAQMGWLLVGIELATLPLRALVDVIGKRLQQGDLTVDMDVSIANLFVALVLFILARVFREGTRLRDEVEGTV